jgi:hypothetical protein
MTTGGSERAEIVAYRDFFDVPRAFLIEPRVGLLLFFDCPFDDSIDDYGLSYAVFSLPTLKASELPANWGDLDAFKVGPLATVPISALHFDETRRREVLIDGLDKIIGVAQSATGFA